MDYRRYITEHHSLGLIPWATQQVPATTGKDAAGTKALRPGPSCLCTYDNGLIATWSFIVSSSKLDVSDLVSSYGEAVSETSTTRAFQPKATQKPHDPTHPCLLREVRCLAYLSLALAAQTVAAY